MSGLGLAVVVCAVYVDSCVSKVVLPSAYRAVLLVGKPCMPQIGERLGSRQLCGWAKTSSYWCGLLYSRCCH